MPAPLTLVPTSDDLSQSADAVIIGACIVGVFGAYYLAARGLRVALLEKGFVGAEQSRRNWRWCHQQNRDIRELPMATKSLDLRERFMVETGEDTGFRRCGLLYLSNNEKELDGWARWRDFARSVGVTTHVLDIITADERGKATGRFWKGGVFSPTDGTADPAGGPAVARTVIKLGSSVHRNYAARGIEMEGVRLSAIVTEPGTIRTKAAILSGGAWVSSFCRPLGIRFPQASMRSSILSVGPGCDDLPDAHHTAGVSVTRRRDGGCTLGISGRGRIDPTAQNMRFAAQFIPMYMRRRRSISPGGVKGIRNGHKSLKKWRLDHPTPMEEMRMLDPVIDRNTIKLTAERAMELLPDFGGRPVTAAWASYIDSAPDGVPAIGETTVVPGLVLAAGFGDHGFGIGPGVGHLIADIISGAQPIVDPIHYRPERVERSSWGKVADF